ncbi:alpha/beta hydrolase [Acinetobacter sp. S40]|uniref:lipase family protein n=1 Tax=unclassified Acinetobacter TaxID=196816 RepID=UPI00190AD745|nr:MULTISPECIES: lipase family protein [unclassified Acinetobacter]MBJ9984752.1 alpha/beta hydrolase [Acinetobacter sp. S40]MBK0062517.1 alpha/beta hydrolase [Acinetobacter sp. S55]MBK0066321.1 alpha/beta hydrolase [Acinetobacter sp. S54]
MIRKFMVGGLLGFGLQQVQALPVPVEHSQPNSLYGDKVLSAFYEWNEKIPQHPGLLLRIEPLDEGIRLAESQEQYRILFSSTNGLDSRSTTLVSGSLFIPKGQAPEGGWPLLVWGHGTVGLADQCAPSWSGRVYRNAYYLNQWLKQGYAIVEPDYQGLGVGGPHLLINIPQLSFNILDSARAALKANPKIANKIIIAGQSQGGAAAFGAASYSEKYAPDLNIKGTIATGVIYKPKQSKQATLNIANRQIPNPALAYQILGFHVLQQYDPSLKTTDVFTEKAAALVEHSRSQCVGQIFSDVAFEQLSFADALLEYPSEKYLTLQRTFEQQFSQYPTLKIKHPVFIGTGVEDKTPDARNQMALVKDACAQGTAVQAHLYHGRGHSEAVPRSLPDALNFARQALNDEAIPNLCSIDFN